MARNPYHDHLREVPMFSGLGKKELDAVSSLVTQYDAKDGEVLMTQGGTAREMYILVNGTLTVSVDGEELKQLTNGEFVGEMSLLTQRHRLVTVTAKGPAELLHLDGPSFESLLHEVPMIAVKMLPEVARHGTEVTGAAIRTMLDGE